MRGKCFTTEYFSRLLSHTYSTKSLTLLPLDSEPVSHIAHGAGIKSKALSMLDKLAALNYTDCLLREICKQDQGN